MPEDGVFTSTKKRRNARRCHIFEETNLTSMNGRDTSDIFIVATRSNTDAIYCYRMICPRYLREYAAGQRNKRTPTDLIVFDETASFSLDSMISQLAALTEDHPRVRIPGNITWQDAFLLLEMYVTTLFLNSTSSARPKLCERPVKIIDTTAYHLDKNKYDLCHVYKTLNIYNVHIIVVFILWFLLHDKRNVVFSSVWQPTLENFYVYELWHALSKIPLVGQIVERSYRLSSSLNKLQIKCTREFAREIALGPYKRLVHGSSKLKRLVHTYKAPLSTQLQYNFSIIAQTYNDVDNRLVRTLRSSPCQSNPAPQSPAHRPNVWEDHYLGGTIEIVAKMSPTVPLLPSNSTWEIITQSSCPNLGVGQHGNFGDSSYSTDPNKHLRDLCHTPPIMNMQTPIHHYADWNVVENTTSDFCAPYGL